MWFCRRKHNICLQLFLDEAVEVHYIASIRDHIQGLLPCQKKLIPEICTVMVNNVDHPIFVALGHTTSSPFPYLVMGFALHHCIEDIYLRSLLVVMLWNSFISIPFGIINCLLPGKVQVQIIVIGTAATITINCFHRPPLIIYPTKRHVIKWAIPWWTLK